MACFVIPNVRAAEFNLDSATQEDMIPADAKEPKIADLGWGKEYWFTAERKYPTFAFGIDELARWKARGFRVCKISQPEWDSYVDARSNKQIRRFTKAMVLYNGARLVVLTGEYRSTNPSVIAAGELGPIDTTTQIGMVMVYGPIKEATEQIMAAQGADCR
jgi:hypothetical protein